MTRVVRFSNNAVSRLAANLAVGGTSISLTPGEGSKFPTLTGSQFFMGTLVKSDGTTEIVKVTARATDTLTVVRAAEPVAGSSTAYAFTAGDRFELRLTAGATGDEFDRLDDAATNGTLATGTWNINVSGNAATAATATNATSAAACTGNSATVTNGVYTTGDQTVGGTKTFSSAPVIPGVNGGQLAGMRNKIINGKMEIAQRGTSFVGWTATTSPSYSLDRWRIDQAGHSAVYTVTQQADAPSNNEFQYSYRVAITTADTSIAAGDVFAISQYIEGFNVRDLIGKTFTLSFWVRSSKTGTHCVSLINSIPNRTYVAEYTVSAANTWEYKTITVSGGLITAGTWDWTTGIGLGVRFALAGGTTYQTTAGAWQTGNFTNTSAQVNCLDSNTNIFALTGVQLEVGGVATPFEHRPYGAELALCQRYFCKTFPYATVPAQAVGSNVGALGAQNIPNTNAPWVYWQFPVIMRAAPTVTTFSPKTADANWRNTSNTTSMAVVTIDGGGASESGVYITGSTVLATASNYYIHATASSEL